MRIIGNFGSIAVGEDYRDKADYVYTLGAHGSNCPENLSVFYIGLTNNPLARLQEHMSEPHSGPLKAMMDCAENLDWKIEMQLSPAFFKREAAEKYEKEMIEQAINSGVELMNMEGLYGLVERWIEDQITIMEYEKKNDNKHNAHVIEFRKQR